jgi:methylated-DNA-[protein]-cysteine S-methyltransferase
MLAGGHGSGNTSRDRSNAMTMQTESSTQARYRLFETAIGSCGVAWSESGVTRLALPEADAAATEMRLKARTGAARANDFPTPIGRVVDDVQRYARGEQVDFSSVAVDLAGIDRFRRSVYDTIRSLGWGQTASYGEIARRIGAPDPREVGQALGQNPIPLIIPCHRIVASDGKLGGFSAPGGRLTKERLLALEGFGADAPRLPGL